jgi:hypothetical protein
MGETETGKVGENADARGDIKERQAGMVMRQMMISDSVNPEKHAGR